MRVFSGFYVTAVAISCVVTLAFARVGAEDVSPSPYSKEVEQARERAIVDAKLNENTVPGEGALMEGGFSDDSGWEENYTDPVAANVRGASKAEASKPIDKNTRQAQKVLHDELTAVGAFDRMDKERAEAATEAAGSPDNKVELAASMQDDEGHGIRPELTAEQKMRANALTYGLAGH